MIRLALEFHSVRNMRKAKMGDVFKNIDGVIVNRSYVGGSVGERAEGVSLDRAIAQLKAELDERGSEDAIALCGDLAEELTKPEPDSSRARALLESLKAASPAVASTGNAITAIAKAIAEIA